MKKTFLILFFSTLFISACKSSPQNNISLSLSTPSTPTPIISASNAAITTTASTTTDSALVGLAYQNSHLEIKIPLSQASLSQSDPNNFSFTTPDNNLEIQYQLLKNGLKENIILNKTPSSNQFSTSLKITNADVYLNNDRIFTFYDSRTNKYLFHFQAPYAIDAAGHRTNNVTYQLLQNGQPLTTNPYSNNTVTVNFSEQPYKLGTGSNYTLLITVDPSWLSNKNRAYPVTIDPTVITDTYTGTSYINTDASSNYLVSGGNLTIGDSGTAGCWGTSGSCNSDCLFSNQASDSYNDFWGTYIDEYSCSSYMGNNYVYGSCSTNGTGSCYTASTSNCSCEAIPPYTCSSTTNYILNLSCTWIGGGYYTSATVQSTNLLIGRSSVDSITTFSYSLSSLPTSTSVGVKFSQDASTWKNSSGSIGATNPLSLGVTTPINLTGLGWTGAYFYYLLTFASTGTSTPVVNDVSVTYSTSGTAPPTTNILLY